jgi:hypothetical protein
MDTAHRIGPIKDGNQNILVRFFRREIVDIILTNKRMLKGESMSLFQDTTRRNRTLIWNLSQRAEVESAWSQSGSVWAKLHSNPKKIRVKITDNIDEVLKKHHISEKLAAMTIDKSHTEATASTSSLLPKSTDIKDVDTPLPSTLNQNGSPSTQTSTAERPLITQPMTSEVPDGQSSTPTIHMVPDYSTVMGNASSLEDPKIDTAVSSPPVNAIVV